MMRLICVCGALVLIGSACSGSSGGPVAGATDTHCTLPDGGVQAQPVNPESCQGTGTDAGVIDYGPTRFNAESDDDDCKYHVRFTNSDVKRNQDVDFTVVATEKATGAVAADANLDAEVFLSETHPAPNSGQESVEGPPGTYRIGPVRFDAAGRWTVRFHLHEECADESKDSPHGHVAFYVDVP
jgi:hypothetical protein